MCLLNFGPTANLGHVVAIAKLKDAVYVLHCFQKKTQKTAQKDIDLSNKRLRELMQGQIL